MSSERCPTTLLRQIPVIRLQEETRFPCSGGSRHILCHSRFRCRRDQRLKMRRTFLLMKKVRDHCLERHVGGSGGRGGEGRGTRAERLLIPALIGTLILTFRGWIYWSSVPVSFRALLFPLWSKKEVRDLNDFSRAADEVRARRRRLHLHEQ